MNNPYLEEAKSPRIYGRTIRSTPSRLSPVRRGPSSPCFESKIHYVVPLASRPPPPPDAILNEHLRVRLVLRQNEIGQILIDKSATLARLRTLVSQFYGKKMSNSYNFATSKQIQDSFPISDDAFALPQQVEAKTFIVDFADNNTSHEDHVSKTPQFTLMIHNFGEDPS